MAEVLSRSTVMAPCRRFSVRLQHPSLGFRSSSSSSAAVGGSRRMYADRNRIMATPTATPSPFTKSLHQPKPKSLLQPKALRWWEKGRQPNMKEVDSAQDLVDSLLTAGDHLVIVDFFSPGCGGCRTLHPKICQIAEMNPAALFIQVNHEEHKSMCYSLGVHVLPFFRFYRGAQGRLCSFSCTISTIKKFKDALAKHGTDRSSLGPAMGLEESELQAFAANRDLNFTYPVISDVITQEVMEEPILPIQWDPPSAPPLICR